MKTTGDICYKDAEKRSIKNYRLISTLDQMLDALNNNLPVAFGMSVFQGFLYVDGLNPIVRMPYSTEPSIGGHAMVLVGYDKDTERLTAKNSFGKDWGEEGYCYIPFEYAKKHLFDCWVFDIDLK
jgi:C1A family cysteine protease